LIIAIIGAMLLGFLFGEISLLLQKLNEQSALYDLHYTQLKRSLMLNNVPSNLQKKAEAYFDFCWRKNVIYHKNADFSQLSQPLQRDIAFNIHKKLILKVPLFEKLEPSEIMGIITRLK
jgi:hypothetical protein